VSHTDKTAREGVEAIRLALVEMGWYPREPSDPDYGIDLLAESAIDDALDGRMLPMQIKSGPSHVVHRTNTHVTLRCSDRHVKYWLGHSLSVVVFWYDLDQKIAYWQHVTGTTTVSTGQRWKIDIPLTQALNSSNEALLRALTHQERIGVPKVDWASVLARGPLSVLDAGKERYAAATALRAQQPASASEQFMALAGELEAHVGDDAGSLAAAAERLRGKAATISFESGDPEEACRILTVSIRHSVVLVRQPLRVYTDQLRAWLETERWWIADAWPRPASPVARHQAL
jgi:hypothetical protein